MNYFKIDITYIKHDGKSILLYKQKLNLCFIFMFKIPKYNMFLTKTFSLDALASRSRIVLLIIKLNYA